MKRYLFQKKKITFFNYSTSVLNSTHVCTVEASRLFTNRKAAFGLLPPDGYFRHLSKCESDWIAAYCLVTFVCDIYDSRLGEANMTVAWGEGWCKPKPTLRRGAVARLPQKCQWGDEKWAGLVNISPNRTFELSRTTEYNPRETYYPHTHTHSFFGA